MRLELFKTLWGAVGAGTPHPTFAESIPAAAREGWDGVGFSLVAQQTEPAIGSLQELEELCTEHGLGLTTVVQTSGETVDDHLKTLRSELMEISPLTNRHVVCHGGRDAFDEAQAIHFFEEALRMAADLGITVAYETHRLRILYNPWTTERLLDRFDDLLLSLDLSHWVVVAERLIDDQLDIIRKAAARAIHVDARVGHPEGPQVPDPRAPEWEEAVAAHLRWWDLVWEEQEAAGRATSIMVPEFGPPPYQQTDPGTGHPTADVIDIALFMAELLRRRFASKRQSTPR